MQDGIMLVGLPEVTLHLVRAISLKVGQQMVDVIGDAIMEKAKRHLSDDEIIQAMRDGAKGDGSDKSR